MSIESAGFLAGRAIVAVVLGFLALGNLLDLEASVGYADHKGVPAASVAVPIGSLALLAGSLALLLGVYPRLGAAVVIGFLAVVTPAMHDFWTMSGQEREAELAQFLKNVALVGTALAFLAIDPATWPYAFGPVL